MHYIDICTSVVNSCVSFDMQDFQTARGEMNGVNLLQIDICIITIKYLTLHFTIIALLLSNIQYYIKFMEYITNIIIIV